MHWSLKYPSLCVRRREPQIIPRVDPKSILQAFLKDVNLKMPSVCGLPLQFCDQAKYTKNVMAGATLQVHLLSSNTLSSEPPQTSKKLPMRSLSSIPGAACLPSMSGRMPTSEPAITKTSSNSLQHSSKDILPSLAIPHHPINSFQTSCPAFRVPFSFQEEQQCINQIPSTVQRINSSPRIVPLFQPREVARGVQQIEPTNHPGPRIVPTFKPSKKRTMLVPTNSASNLPKSSKQIHHRESLIQLQKMQKMVTSREPVRREVLSSPTLVCAPSCGSMHEAATSLPIRNTLSAPMNATSAVPACTISLTSEASRLDHLSQAASEPAIKTATPFQQRMVPVTASAMVSTDGLSWSFPFASYPSQQRDVSPQDIDRFHQKKRVQEDCNSNQNVKRAKTGPPQVQPNVELMAVNDQLHKVNAVTLTTWLKGKNIYVKSREKKADLIQKVLNFITAQKSEN